MYPDFEKALVGAAIFILIAGITIGAIVVLLLNY